MKRLRNGSLLSNVLLIAAGGIAGASLTWTLAPRADRAPGAVRTVPASSAPATPLPHSTVSQAPANENRIKLSQVVNADDPAHKAEDLNRLARDVAAHDPSEAIAMADEIPSEEDRVVFLRGAFEAWAAKDPQAAAQYAESQLPPGAARSEALRTALYAWGQTNPRAAFQWMEDHLSGPLKEEGLVALAQGWSRRSPEKAAQWFADTGSTSQPLLSAITSTWARQNATAAAAWAATLRDGTNRDVGITSALGELARQDPAAAAAAALPFLQSDPAANPAGTPVRDLAGVLADIWATSDPAAAATWIRQLPAGAAQIEAAGTLATVWASHDIQAAITWSQSLGDPDLKSAVITHLGTTWGAIEPDRALAWLDTLPPETAARGTQGALNSWAATDPAGLADWIEQLPASARNDQARRSLGDVLSSDQPVAALELAAGISDPIRQSDSLARYYRTFYRTDPAGATEWLQGEINRFPAPARQSLSQEHQKLLLSARRRSP